jgi:hypothetical protein
MAPAGMPREILERCATAPLATSARPLALAAMSLSLHFLDHYEGHGFAEWAAFGDSYVFAFFHV